MKTQNRCTIVVSRCAGLFLIAAFLGGSAIAPGAQPLEQGFRHPPDSARPWVYWFWLNGNITREGITADLEAMKRVGIGGVLIMEVDQGAPLGPVGFMSPEWRELFKHVIAEADRLGLEVNMNDDAGWNGSGGPWIRPEQSMQKVVWTETELEGPRRVDTTLAQPQTVAGFYRDIAVLAFPTPGPYRIENIRRKAGYQSGEIGPSAPIVLPAEMTIPSDRVTDITARMDNAGRLVWDVPPGAWTVLRFGHTSTGVQNAPAPASGRGLECDKLSAAGIEANFDGMMRKLIADVGPAAGKTLVSTHVDSWENGMQNWTSRMPEEFRNRRGYDLLPFLPAITGRVVGSLERSERFLWDLRQTISELVVEHYAGRLRELAHEHGLRLSIEAYGGAPTDDLPYAGQADEPMCEFWVGGGGTTTRKGMASAAHTYGKRILGAEAFTAGRHERWLAHPATVKALGDQAFCDGVNRMVFHRYAMQPWLDRRPGMTMGPWGLHYERTQTWWDWSPGWHEYLARCQFLLRQGLFVADVCYLQPEAAPQAFPSHERRGYDYDNCSADAVLTRMSVKDGRIVLPDGMSYALLVLPGRSMTPQLLRKIKELVDAGASVIGSRPRKSPSLSDYPRCDEELKELADALWGEDRSATGFVERACGKGRVFWKGSATTTEQLPHDARRLLAQALWIWHKEGNPVVGVPPGMRYFRRTFTIEPGRSVESARLTMTADNTFVATLNGQPAGSGYDHTRVHIMDVTQLLKPGLNLLAVAAGNGGDKPNPAGLIGSLHVRFTDGGQLQVITDRHWESTTEARHDWAWAADSSEGWGAAMELGPFGMAPWTASEAPPANAYPASSVIYEALRRRHVPPDFTTNRMLHYIHRRAGDADIYFVANGEDAWVEADCAFRVTGKLPELWWPESGRIEPAPMFTEREGHTRIPVSLGPNGSVFVVFRRSDPAADPVVELSRNGMSLWSLSRAAAPPPKIVVQKARYGVLDDPSRTRDVRARVQRLVDAGETEFRVARMAEGDDPAPMVVKRLLVEYTVDGRPLTATATDPEYLQLGSPAAGAEPGVELHRADDGGLRVEARQPGRYELKTVSGRTHRIDVPTLPAAQRISGPWHVTFPPGGGAPERITLNELVSWSEHADPGVRYFSGTATYSKTINIPSSLLGKNRRLFLDLGKVQVMAEVMLNGTRLGVLWKSPYRVDIAAAARGGDNTLEVKVVNLWPNRMIGDERLPEDSLRHENGTLKEWPAWLLAGKPSPTGRFTFTTWRLWTKDDPLQASGLLGPVTLYPVAVVDVEP
jgi:hypothetical protein